jgi:TBC domain-containing protein kinase-like protein
MVSRNLCLENILLDSSMNVKLFNHGVHYVTNGGKYVAFPIGSPKYSPPDVFLSAMTKGNIIYSCDVWSLGIIVLEILIGKELWADLKLPQIIKKVASLVHCENGILQRILQEHHCLHILKVQKKRFAY